MADTPHVQPRASLTLAQVMHLLSSLPERYGRPQTNTAYIPQLDGLRALAIILVLFWHGSLRIVRQTEVLEQSGFDVTDVFYRLPHGEIGVILFFVISGFVIAQPFLSRPAGAWSVGTFYVRRLHRLYPPYLLALLLCLLPHVLGIWTDKNPHGIPLYPSLLAHLAYLNGVLFNTASRFNPPTWSLEIEIQFYVISPLLMLLYVSMATLRGRMIAAGAVVVLLIGIAGLVHGPIEFDSRYRFGLLAHLHLFIVGIALADAERWRTVSRRELARSADLGFFAGCVLLISLGVWMTQVDANVPGIWPYIATQLALVLAILSIYHGAMHGPTMSRALAQPWLCLIGTMCYSIYLIHIVVIEAASQVLKRLPLHSTLLLWIVWWPAILVVVALASLIFFVGVERPFMNRRLPGLRAVMAAQALRRR